MHSILYRVGECTVLSTSLPQQNAETGAFSRSRELPELDLSIGSRCYRFAMCCGISRRTSKEKGRARVSRTARVWFLVGISPLCWGRCGGKSIMCRAGFVSVFGTSARRERTVTPRKRERERGLGNYFQIVRDKG